VIGIECKETPPCTERYWKTLIARHYAGGSVGVMISSQGLPGRKTDEETAFWFLIIENPLKNIIYEI
jgi:hypothetical protein